MKKNRGSGSGSGRRLLFVVSSPNNVHVFELVKPRIGHHIPQLKPIISHPNIIISLSIAHHGSFLPLLLHMAEGLK